MLETNKGKLSFELVLGIVLEGGTVRENDKIEIV